MLSSRQHINRKYESGDIHKYMSWVIYIVDTSWAIHIADRKGIVSVSGYNSNENKNGITFNIQNFAIYGLFLDQGWSLNWMLYWGAHEFGKW